MHIRRDPFQFVLITHAMVVSGCALFASESYMVCRNASGVSPPQLGDHGFAFSVALLLICADQNNFRANQKERE